MRLCVCVDAWCWRAASVWVGVQHQHASAAGALTVPVPVVASTGAGLKALLRCAGGLSCSTRRGVCCYRPPPLLPAGGLLKAGHRQNVGCKMMYSVSARLTCAAAVYFLML